MFTAARTSISLRSALLAGVAVLMSGAGAGAADNINGEVNKLAPLYEKLPAAIKERGYIVSATTGRYPPYNFLAEDGATLKGAGIDLSIEMSKVLGVPVKTEISESTASFITGVISGRYNFVLGTVADTAERQKTVDMVDWTRQTTAFLVPEGNPKNINGIADVCGLRIAVQKASFAEPVLHQQDELCKKDGKPAININVLSDQAAIALAIKADRVDASFAGNAALVYFHSLNEGAYDVVGAGENLMGDLWQASVTPKGSEVTQVIYAAWKMMFDNGSYGEVMKRWGVDGDMIAAPGVNMAK